MFVSPVLEVAKFNITVSVFFFFKAGKLLCLFLTKKLWGIIVKNNFVVIDQKEKDKTCLPDP